MHLSRRRKDHFFVDLTLGPGDGERQRCTKSVLSKLAQHSSIEMPTILRSGPYRVYFHSHEANESPHVHVDRDQASFKVWISPVTLAYSMGFKANELREV